MRAKIALFLYLNATNNFVVAKWAASVTATPLPVATFVEMASIPPAIAPAMQ